MASNKVELSIRDMPECLWELRHLMARMLRDAADGEPEIVAKKLYELATVFEVGGVGD